MSFDCRRLRLSMLVSVDQAVKFVTYPHRGHLNMHYYQCRYLTDLSEEAFLACSQTQEEGLQKFYYRNLALQSADEPRFLLWLVGGPAFLLFDPLY